MINLRFIRVFAVLFVPAFVIWCAADNAVMTNDVSSEIQSGIIGEKQVQLCLTTDGISEKGYARVLVNGDEYCLLDAEEKYVSINYGDVIEIDARNVKKPINVILSDITGSVYTDSLNTNIYVNSSIELIGTVKEK